jgi:hypothetical protein
VRSRVGAVTEKLLAIAFFVFYALGMVFFVEDVYAEMTSGNLRTAYSYIAFFLCGFLTALILSVIIEVTGKRSR